MFLTKPSAPVVNMIDVTKESIKLRNAHKQVIGGIKGDADRWFLCCVWPASFDEKGPKAIRREVVHRLARQGEADL
jgi:hypothetical protein